MAKIPPAPAKKPLTAYGKAEKPGLLQKYGPWAFIVLACLAIGLMIKFSAPQRELNCRSISGGSPGLTSFGTCVEQ